MRTVVHLMCCLCCVQMLCQPSNTKADLTLKSSFSFLPLALMISTLQPLNKDCHDLGAWPPATLQCSSIYLRHPLPPHLPPKSQQPKPTTFTTQLSSPTPQHSTTTSPHFPVLSPPHPQSWLEAKYNLCLKVEL